MSLFQKYPRTICLLLLLTFLGCTAYLQLRFITVIVHPTEREILLGQRSENEHDSCQKKESTQKYYTNKCPQPSNWRSVLFSNGFVAYISSVLFARASELPSAIDFSLAFY